MRVMRAARRRTRIAGISCAGEAVSIGEIYSESPAGPEVGPIERVVDDDVPPVQPPLFGSFSLLPGLPDNALGILDDLVRADRALGQIPWPRRIG